MRQSRSSFASASALRLMFPRQSEVIELGGLRAQAGFDVAQALPIGQLREGKTQKLVQTTEAAHVEVAAILRHQTTKRVPRRKRHHLRKHELASVHWHPRTKSRQAARSSVRNSSH